MFQRGGFFGGFHDRARSARRPCGNDNEDRRKRCTSQPYRNSGTTGYPQEQYRAQCREECREQYVPQPYQQQQQQQQPHHQQLVCTERRRRQRSAAMLLSDSEDGLGGFGGFDDDNDGPPLRGFCDEEYARTLQHQFEEEAAEKVARASCTCPLCFDTVPYEQTVQLDCLHRFCWDCFNSLLEVKIREKTVLGDELCCPMPGCRTEVTVHQVEGATRGTPLWDRFLAARAQYWRPKSTDCERLCQCPTAGCDGSFLVPVGVKDARCPECRQSFCTICEAKHPGLTCESFKSSRCMNREDQDFEELVKQMRWQRCPGCRAVSDRHTGCNYMTCKSDVCRGNTSFCYLCGDKLTWTQHLSHYPKGVFQNVCVHVDKTDDVDLPKVRIVTDPSAGIGAAIGDYASWMFANTAG